MLSDRYDVDTFLTRITDAAARRPLVGARAFVAALRPLRGDRRHHREGPAATPGGDAPEARVDGVGEAQRQAIDRARGDRSTRSRAPTSFDLATLSVALRAIRTLATVDRLTRVAATAALRLSPRPLVALTR